MTRHLLLFDAECLACSDVAKAVRATGVPGLTAASLHDPDVRRMLAGAGHPVPDRPALVRVDGTDTDARVRCWTGMAMRARMVRLLGPRRAGGILRLLALELQARARRRAGTDAAAGASRRRFLGGAAATALAGAAALALPSAARAATPDAVALTADQRRRTLAAPQVREAIATWGPVDADRVSAVRGRDGSTVAMIPHRGSAAVTFAGTGADPVVLTLTGATGQITYHLPGGAPLARMRLDGERPRVTRVEDPGTAEPEGRKEFAVCFAACLAVESVSDGCVLSCIACVGSPLSCVSCVACAGTHGIQCANSCKGHL